MSNNTRIILIIAGLLVCICGGLCTAAYIALPQLSQSFVGQAQDPANMQRIASEIADFDLPPGYKGLFGIDFFTTKMVMYSAGANSTNILAIFQVASQNANREVTEQQMHQQLERNSNGSCTGTKVVGQEMLTVKGAPTVFVISECSQHGVQMRQEIGAFQGRGGLAIVIGMSPANRWDGNAFRQFVESIR